MQNYTVLLENEQQTLTFGKKIADHSQRLHIIYLNGVLGAGKTTLTRGILRGLGYEGTVKSPTYTLVETYTLGPRIIHHFDLYRLQNMGDLEEMGFRDYFADDTLCLIEWPERAAHLPLADLNCNLAIADQSRTITLTANTPAGWQVIKEVVNGQDV